MSSPIFESASRVLANAFLRLTTTERRALPQIDALSLGLAVFRTHSPTAAELLVSGSADSVVVQFLPRLPDDVVAALHEAGWRTSSNDDDETPSNTWWHQ